jgi:glycine/D-amino acid oxidase-like deaminating enzyme
MDKHYDAIIIGGGVAGLTAALHLAERGLKPLILEVERPLAGVGWLAGKAPSKAKFSSRAWRAWNLVFVPQSQIDASAI